MADLLKPVSGIDETRTFPVWVSEEEYLRVYAELGYEYEEGELIRVTAAEKRHNHLNGYLYGLLYDYFDRTRFGEVILSPFPLRLGRLNRRFREPDLMIVLNRHADQSYSTYTDFADVCVEIVSKESVERDTVTKFAEYEKLGIPEYWLLNPLDKTTRFFRDTSGRKYELQAVQNGVYSTPLLPRFQFDTSLLWANAFPAAPQIARMVDDMLNTPDAPATATTPNPPSET